MRRKQTCGITKFILLPLLAIALISCGSSVHNLVFRPTDQSAEMFSKIKKDIIDKALQIGTQRGYAILSYDYEKGTAVLRKQYMDIVWPVNISTFIKDGEVAVNIYSPGGGKYPTGSGPDMDEFYAGIKNLYGGAPPPELDYNFDKTIDEFIFGNTKVVAYDGLYKKKPVIFYATYNGNEVNQLIKISKDTEDGIAMVNEFMSANKTDRKKIIHKAFLDNKVDLGPIE